MQGNPTLLIWLGKQWLGQTDRLVLVSKDQFMDAMQRMGEVVAQHVQDQALRDKIRAGWQEIESNLRDVDGFA